MGDVLRLRNAALVGSVLTEPPEGVDAQLRRTYEATAKVIDAYAPSLIKKGREAARAETQHVVDAGVTAAIKAVREEHKNELTSLAHHIEGQVGHRLSAVRGMWLCVGILAGAMLGTTGTVYVFYKGMFGVVAASRSATEVWTPPSQELSVREPDAHAPEAGVDHNPFTGRRLAEPADAP